MARKTAGRTAEAPEREYVERDFGALRGLKDIPDALMEAHLKLYAGYVKNTQMLRQRLTASESASPEWSEMQRRMGFELNGLRLHELYFDHLWPGGAGVSRETASLLGESWASFDAWERDFRAIGMMRGVGWAILYRDPVTLRLSNHWITLHQDGHPAGFTPILVMDVWEHAFTGMERERYIDAFFANLNWDEVAERLKSDR
jgi:Fe-Mn family superoxide dismutase